jgi:hypothetical protein
MGAIHAKGTVCVARTQLGRGAVRNGGQARNNSARVPATVRTADRTVLGARA